MKNYFGWLCKDEDSDYGVSFPDFPGLITAGETLDEARRLAEEALRFHIEGMIADGDPLPEPSSLEVITRDPSNKEGVAFLISVKTPETGQSASTSHCPKTC